MSRSLIGHGSGHSIAPRPWARARVSQSTMPALRRSASPHETRPCALKSPPANTGRHSASGSSDPIRSAASHEYGDIAPKKKSARISG